MNVPKEGSGFFNIRRALGHQGSDKRGEGLIVVLRYLDGRRVHHLEDGGVVFVNHFLIVRRGLYLRRVPGVRPIKDLSPIVPA